MDKSKRSFLSNARDYFLGVHGDLVQSRRHVALLMVNIFVIIAVILAAFTAVGLVAYHTGTLDLDVLLSPILFLVIILAIAAVITVSVYVVNRQYLILPMRAMVKAADELGRGNFDVRVNVEDRETSPDAARFADGFNAAAEALGSLEVMRAGFVDDFSHEFKTPIVSINGFAGLLLEDDVSEDERREYAQIIYDESARLAAIASDIVLLRQAEHTTIIANAAPVDVAEAVRRAVIALQGKWGEKGLTFELELGDDGAENDEVASFVVLGSETLLDRAIANLLDNACKFSPAGGTVRLALRVATAGEGNGHVALTVENDGPAITPEAQAHIFERFYQADKSHATQGAGLGLPLVARVATLHGGTVRVQSTPTASCASSAAAPEGHTTFTLELPLC